MIVEAVCCSLEDALAAERAGASRVELCSAIELGGLTPSVGLVRAVKEKCGLPAVAMVRPRAGGFAYRSHEIEVMARDCRALLEAGIDGLVIAALTPGRLVDEAACALLLNMAGDGKQLVFHRAFDATPDLFASLETLITLGFTRILTSGGSDTALEGASTLRRLVEQAKGRIEILPAGGVRASNARAILAQSGATQLHLGPMKDVEDRTAPFYGTTHRVLDEDAMRSVIEAAG